MAQVNRPTSVMKRGPLGSEKGGTFRLDVAPRLAKHEEFRYRSGWRSAGTMWGEQFVKPGISSFIRHGRTILACRFSSKPLPPGAPCPR